eukprot:g5537.t1
MEVGDCATIQSVRQCCESQCESQCAILQSDDNTTLRYRDYYDVPAKCVQRTEVHEKIATSQCFYLDMIDSLMALVPEQKIQEPTDAAVEMSTGNGLVKIVKRTDGKDGEYDILPCIDGLEKKDIGIEYVRAMRTNEAFSSKTGVMCIDGDVFHNEVVLLASFVESGTLTQAGTVESGGTDGEEEEVLEFGDIYKNPEDTVEDIEEEGGSDSDSDSDRGSAFGHGDIYKNDEQITGIRDSLVDRARTGPVIRKTKKG